MRWDELSRAALSCFLLSAQTQLLLRISSEITFSSDLLRNIDLLLVTRSIDLVPATKNIDLLLATRNIRLLLAIRNIDPLVGVTSEQLSDPDKLTHKVCFSRPTRKQRQLAFYVQTYDEYNI
jgi:hypothetical protein